MAIGLSAAFVRQKFGVGLVSINQFKKLRDWIGTLISANQDEEQVLMANIYKEKDTAVRWTKGLVAYFNDKGRKSSYNLINQSVIEAERNESLFDIARMEYLTTENKESFWAKNSELDTPQMRKAFGILDTNISSDTATVAEQLAGIYSEHSIRFKIKSKEQLIDALKKIDGILILNNMAKLTDGRDVVIWKFDKMLVHIYFNNPVTGKYKRTVENASYELIYELFKSF